MTIKEEMGTATLQFMTESGEWQRIGRAINMTEITDQETIDTLPIDLTRYDFPIDIECDIQLRDGLTTSDFWLILMGVCTVEQVTCNNWRRMHGMAMKKRKRK